MTAERLASIRPERFDSAAVGRLTVEVQTFYRSVYGGEGDSTPVEPGQFTEPYGRFFVAYDDDEPVAMGGWRFVPAGEPVPGERPAEIKRMYVVDGARGRGLAREMLRHLERSALEAGADWMILETGEPQVAAVGLYRTCGYDPITKFGHYAHEDDSVSLGKSLA